MIMPVMKRASRGRSYPASRPASSALSANRARQTPFAQQLPTQYECERVYATFCPVYSPRQLVNYYSWLNSNSYFGESQGFSFLWNGMLLFLQIFANG